MLLFHVVWSQGFSQSGNLAPLRLLHDDVATLVCFLDERAMHGKHQDHYREHPK
jgi:hypothetical protein